VPKQTPVESADTSEPASVGQRARTRVRVTSDAGLLLVPALWFGAFVITKASGLLGLLGFIVIAMWFGGEAPWCERLREVKATIEHLAFDESRLVRSGS
jgi:hypothetical protein